MNPEAMQDVKRLSLAIFAIAERATLERLEGAQEVEAVNCIRQAAGAILQAVEGAREGVEAWRINK